MKLIAKGAEAEIFEFEGKGGKRILKRRVQKKYRVPELDLWLRRQRTKKEAKILHAAKNAGIICPLLFNADLQKTELVLEEINGIRLREYLGGNHRNENNMLKNAGSELAKLHNANIVHGDFSTANIIIAKGGRIALIDFGLSDFSPSAEDKATDLLVFKKSVNAAQFKYFLAGYKKACANYNLIIHQLADIEKRGRYVARAQAA